MLGIAYKLFNKLRNDNIEYCHFKSNQHLEAALNGDTDLDILVNIKDQVKFERILLELNFKKFEPNIIGKYPGVHNWYGFDKEEGKLLHIHLHYQLATGKALIKDYILPWNELILKNAIIEENSNVKICNPNYEYILLCTRIILKRKIKENILSIKRNIYLSSDLSIELEYLRNLIEESILKDIISREYTYNGDEIYQKFINISNLNLKEFKRLSKLVRKNLKYSRIHYGLYSSALSYYYRFIRSLNRRINIKFNKLLPVKKRSEIKGLSIAFVGIDGSGKSSVSKEINKWLNTEFDTILFYAGAGDGRKSFIVSFLLKMFSILNKYFNKPKKTKKVLVNNKKIKVNFVTRIKNLMGAVVYYKILLDNTKKIIKANEYNIYGGFCIMDRFPQGHIINDHDGPKVNRYLSNRPFCIVKTLAKKEIELFNKIEMKIPKFDIIFRMIVSPEVALTRKSDDLYETLDRRSKSLKTIPFSVNKIIDVDANKNIDEVVLLVKEKLWEAI